MSIEAYELPAECRSAPSMVDWINSAARDCVDCETLVPVSVCTKWYVEALQENGAEDTAKELKTFALGEGRDALQLAEQLDRIKLLSGLSPGLATYLKELDCTVQVNAAGLA